MWPLPTLAWICVTCGVAWTPRAGARWRHSPGLPAPALQGAALFGTIIAYKMSNKLCSWTQKKIKKEAKDYAGKVVGATHYCASCGRAANDKSLLCKAEAAKT